MRNIDARMCDRMSGLPLYPFVADEMQKRLQENPRQSYDLIVEQINHYSLFAEWFGENRAEAYLTYIGQGMLRMCEKHDGIASCAGRGNFVLFLPSGENVCEQLISHAQNFFMDNMDISVGFLPICGVCRSDDPDLSASSRYDRAVIALTQRATEDQTISFYDENQSTTMQDEINILADFKRALREEEVLFHIQPKYNIESKKIVGGEALARWQHASKGMISPGSFVPVLEKNGLITLLDYHIWEQVFDWQKKQLALRHIALPISVNVSQTDFAIMDVPEVFKELAERYEVPKGLVEVEITESACAQEYAKAVDAINRLQENGFKVLLDDFGSGYSSLNILKDLNADALKIGMKFVDIDMEQDRKNIGILESVINLARHMNLPVIVEGIETPKQLKYLKEMGCRYVQGYLFSKPISADAYEALIKDKENVSQEQLAVRQVEPMHVREFIDQNVYSDTMINNMLGAVAFYAVSEDSIQLMRVNEQYYKMTGRVIDENEPADKRIYHHIQAADVPRLEELFEQAYEDRLSGAKDEFGYFREDGQQLWISLHVFFLSEDKKQRLFYGSLTDVTRLHQQHEDLNERNMQLLEAFKGNAVFLLRFNLTQDEMLNADMDATITASLEKDGKVSYTDYVGKTAFFVEGNKGQSAFRRFTDRNRLLTMFEGKTVVESMDFKAVFEGVSKWFKMVLTLCYTDSSSDIFLMMNMQDIDKEKRHELALEAIAKGYEQREFDPQEIVDRMPGGILAYKNTKKGDIVYANEYVLDLFKCSDMEEFRNLTDNHFEGMIFADDRANYKSVKRNVSFTNDQLDYLRFRIVRKDGQIRWVEVYEKPIVSDGEKLRLAYIAKSMEIISLDSPKGSPFSTAIHSADLLKHFLKRYHGCFIIDKYKKRITVLKEAPEFCIGKRRKPAEDLDQLLQALSVTIREDYRDKLAWFYSEDHFQALADDVSASDEFLYQAVDGRWLKARIAPIIEESGACELAVVTIIDETDTQNKVQMATIEKETAADLMRYYELMFISASENEYVDVIKIDLETGQVFKVQYENGELKDNEIEGGYSGFVSEKMVHVSNKFRDVFDPFDSLDKLRTFPAGTKKAVSFKSTLTDEEGREKWYTVVLRVASIGGDRRIATIFTMDYTDEVAERNKFQELSEKDDLTSLGNRVKWANMVKTEYTKLQSAGVVFFDVNNLRITNDRRGHIAGDRLLCLVADSIRSITSNDVHAYRYGGDEFVLVACNISEENLESLISLWRKRLYMLAETEGFPCTVSIGRAWSGSPVNVERLLRQADMDMYISRGMAENDANTNEIAKRIMPEDGEQARIMKLEQLIQYLRYEFIMASEIDLETGEFNLLLNNDEDVSKIVPLTGNYQKAVETYCNAFVANEHKSFFMETSSLQSLKENLSRIKHVECEYRTQFGDDVWRRTVFHATEYRNGVATKAFNYQLSIDEQKARQLKQQKVIAEAYQSAEAANAAKTEFLSRMSHDIRTPMNAIVGMTMIADTHIQDEEKVRGCLKQISAASRHLLSLINEVLDMSKIEAGKIELEEEPFELADLVDNTITMVRSQLKEHGHQLEVKTENIVHDKVLGDALRIQRVFINLLTNAIKYTPDGGIIRVLIKENDIQNTRYSEYEISVQDNGVGMTEEFQKVLFEPFSREKSALGNVLGTGLGLSIARNLMRLMNGDIMVSSKVGKGSTFTMKMHLALQESCEESNENLRDMQILVAMDSEKMNKTICRMLEKAGLRPYPIATSALLLSTLSASKTSNAEELPIVLLDEELTDGSGLEITKRIRKEIGEENPTILLCAADWTELETVARSAGVDGFLTKPIFQSHLIGTLESIALRNSMMPKDDAMEFGEEFAGKRILLVEDNEINAEIGQEIIEMMGAKVDWASNGRIAVTMMEECPENTYDMILMDIQMPEMNGYDATTAIRNLLRTDVKRIPIIALSANAFSDDVSNAKNSGMDDHVAKPIEPERLFEVMTKYLK